MSDKPEVVPYIVAFMHSPEYYNPYVSISRDTSCQCVEPLIRLSDHEASRAADKARIAELQTVVAQSVEYLDVSSMESILSGSVMHQRLRAALAQKEDAQ